MPANVAIRCQAIPAGNDGAMVLRVEPADSSISLHIQQLRPCPIGINFDAMVMFDMQADGGVDGIDIMHRVRTSVRRGVIGPSLNTKYFRLVVDPLPAGISESDLTVEVVDRNHGMTFLFSKSEVDRVLPIGALTDALLSGNTLSGIHVDLERLSR